MKTKVALPFWHAFVKDFFLFWNVQCLQECTQIIKQNYHFANSVSFTFIFKITEINTLQSEPKPIT